MLRALWFLLKITLLTVALVWFAKNPGNVEVRWQGYVVDTSVAFIATIFAIFLVLYTFFHRLWRSFVSVPTVYRRYRASRRRELGYRDVTAGLVAIAAGDGKSANRHARRALHFIPDAPLTKLLSAQSLLLNGNAPKARVVFAELLDDDNVAFFGVRGLLQEALQSENYREAVQHIRRANDLQPKRLWVVKTLFDLETRNREWKRAEAALKKGEKLGAFKREEAQRHRQALLLAQADDAFEKGEVVAAHKIAAHAFSLGRDFTPAALRLIKFYNHVGKTGGVLKTIESAWAARPHPALAELWMKATPAPKKPSSHYDRGKNIHAWAKRLYLLNPDHHDSLKMMGAAAIEAGQWREARDLLTRAGDYRALAKLEKAESGNEAKAREWLEAANDGQPEAKWICASCGHATPDWSPLCRHCGGFNTFSWTVPELDAHEAPKKIAALAGDVLSAPA